MPLRRTAESGPARSEAVSVDRLAASLAEGSTEERWHAARALGASADGTAALARALRTEQDARVREAILTSLIRLGTPESVDAVLPLLRSDEASLRTAALDALRGMSAEIEPALPILLADPDPDVRVLSCDLAREVPAAAANGLLCALLEREQQANVCAAAIDVLAEIGDATSLPYLQACGERFRDVTFLTFAVQVAAAQIKAHRPDRHG